jgi:C-terminal processing protease CtpA/Prc
VRRTATTFYGLVLCLSLTAVTVAGELGGWFGMSLNVDAGGFVLSPIVNRATVLEVTAKSPAAASGIRPGDEILEVGGLTVAGGKAKELQAALAKAIGESLKLRLKRQSGETYTVVLTAARKPGHDGDT